MADLVNAINRLSELKRQGVLTEEEFVNAKAVVIAGHGSQGAANTIDAHQHLRQGRASVVTSRSDVFAVASSRDVFVITSRIGVFAVASSRDVFIQPHVS